MNASKKKNIIMIGFVVLALFGVISYRIYDNISANNERAAKVSQGRGIAVEIDVTSRRDIVPMLTFSANLEPLWNADISPKVDGRIDKLYVDEGDVVTAGMVIGTLDTNELSAQVMQAEGNLLSSQASLEQAELDLSRAQELAKQGAVAAQALDSARTKRDLTLGQVRSAQGNLVLLQARLDNANIIAPRSGIIIKRYLQAGSYVKAGSQVINIADVSSLLGKATIGESQLNEITVGLPVIIKVNALQDQEFSGVITRISPAATLPARTFTAEITIPNNGVLKSGMFSKIIIPGLIHKNALAVPERALVMREDQKTIYVVTAENKVQQRMLKLGYVGEGWAEVLEGLADGERIVIDGQNKLKDGSTVNASSGQKGEQ
ncbi:MULTISPECIES: efflux RND transporter periplasmic adaptor subunit [Pelosinus]|uniref:Efflux transporter, RND family, MFP subunit n=1 Tax=Pelosinus fermentans B4 TaxID=1149862 RepID=I8RJD0_9FIRM|nr:MULTISPECIES: efflux RND transporter periplasmic adaptor subunit [Pelosinus]EIW18275.1 efflux transporter, RND family, MFP subunit [Pelosinus fermentans B4]EIW24261.1 efflux transporter, RND family, MFP subunit [Pelosinus fermentans A11]OAM94293.1 efflux transporter, RND family, MFP subunit [Pelosinus fermentans DSM 17108]SDR05378.1 RND family efflux transporter, MFP subunit [Pelosinus fermentans]